MYIVYQCISVYQSISKEFNILSIAHPMHESMTHLPVLNNDGPKTGSPDSRFHVIFGFGEPSHFDRWPPGWNEDEKKHGK